MKKWIVIMVLFLSGCASAQKIADERQRGQVLPRASTRYQRGQKIYHSADGEQKYRFPVAQIHP